MKRLVLSVLIAIFIFTSVAAFGGPTDKQNLAVKDLYNQNEAQNLNGRTIVLNGLQYGTRNESDKAAKLRTRSDCYLFDGTGTIMMDGGWQIYYQWKEKGFYDDGKISVDKNGKWTVKAAWLKYDSEGLPYLTAKGNVFADVGGHWAESYIYKMADKGYIQGVGGGLFKPNQEMTRDQFIYILHKVLGIQIMYFKAPDIKEFFKDVSNESYYAGALYDMVIENIVDDKDIFRPNDPISREEMVHYLMNAYIKKGGEEIPTKDLPVNKFADAKDVKGQYFENMNRALRLALIQGRGSSFLKPKGLSTRAEVLVVIDRMLNALENKKEKVNVEVSTVKGAKSFTMKLSITNNSDKTVVINHNNGQKYDFVLLDEVGKEIYRWSKGMAFIEMLTSTEIEPGKTIEFTADLDINENKEMLDKAATIQGYIVGTSEDFKINPKGYRGMITKPEPPKSGVKVEPGFEKTEKALKMKVRIINNTGSKVKISFNSTQQVDFKLFDRNHKHLYTWSMDKLFAQVITEEEIAPGKSLEIVRELDTETYKDIIDKTVYLKAYIIGQSEQFKIDPNEGFEIELK
ncbi:MAG: BsuPI-related putative proteinase inhibitor [Clostridia bacterium]|nr:BsuPI-related putative proteinase inhibitor [Clostridia bacterium]